MSDRVREIAERLKTMREIAGLSVEELGERLTITTEAYAEMEAGEESILMRLIHGASEELSAFSALSSASQPAAALCYFFCEQKRDVCRWLVAPFAELTDLCGVILAADGSFCYVTDDWGDIYGCM